MGFQGRHRFLSNFWPVEVVAFSLPFRSVEHAYQASKSLDPDYRVAVMNSYKAADAKALGRLADLRPDWEDVKDDVMLDLLRQKFVYSNLVLMLDDTGDSILLEDNRWGDRYWGVVDGVGLNRLGMLLMQVREENRERADGAWLRYVRDNFAS